MSVTGEPDGPPQKSGVAPADLFTGVYATVAILAALERRQRIGAGGTLDMALPTAKAMAADGMRAIIVPRAAGP